MSNKEDNILLKGNTLFNNELIQFKSLELNDHHQNDSRKDRNADLRRFNSTAMNSNNYKTNFSSNSAQNYSTNRDSDLFEKLDQFNMNQTIESTVESTKEVQSFSQDMLMKNFNTFLHHHQNQLIAEDIHQSLQINEKDSSFDEETVDYRIEHIRKLASGLFMMNGDSLIKSKSTLKKEIDYGIFDLKNYSNETVDLDKSETTSDENIDKLFELNESKNGLKSEIKNEMRDDIKSELKSYLREGSHDSSETKNHLKSDHHVKKEMMMKNEHIKSDKYESKTKSNYLLEDDLKAFEESLMERYKKISKSNDKAAKLYDSTGELNGNSSPSSLNSIKSSDLSTTIADYNYLIPNNESTGNNQLLNENSIDYLKLGCSDNTKQINEIEQKLNESRTENLNLMIALESNNTTMKKNLEMAKSLKEENLNLKAGLDRTKESFNQLKQQSNLIIDNLMNKNKNLNQELVKNKQILSTMEEEKRKELNDQKTKHEIELKELNELKDKLKEKEDQLKLTTSDLFQANKKIKDQMQKLASNDQKLEECDKKLNIYIKELNNQKTKLELNKEEIEVRKRRILTLEENLGEKISELESLQDESMNLREKTKQLEEKNDKLIQAVKQVDAYADKYKMEYEKRMSKEKDLGDLKQAVKRIIAERDETFKQLELLKANWKQYQQQTAEQQLQLQQQLTTTPSLENKYHYQSGRLSKIYSSPSLTDYYETSNSIVPTTRAQSKHRLNEQNEMLALEKIEDDKNSLINVLSKQNYLNNLLSLSEQLNCNECMLSGSYSQFNTLQMNSSNSKQHLADHCADLMNHIRQQKELQQNVSSINELAYINGKSGKKLKKESQKITKKSKSSFSTLFNPTLMLHGFKHKG